MSDHSKDPSEKTSGPGHEVDSPPTKELFNIVWGLGGLTLLVNENPSSHELWGRQRRRGVRCGVLGSAVSGLYSPTDHD